MIRRRARTSGIKGVGAKFNFKQKPGKFSRLTYRFARGHCTMGRGSDYHDHDVKIARRCFLI